MKNNNPFALLYNNLWLVDQDKLKKLNPDVYAGTNWNKLPESTREETKSTTISIPISVPTDNPGVKSDGLIDNWDELTSRIRACTSCGLCSGRTQAVIERGNRSAKWMFVGEGPGRDEDLQGLPFVGLSGQLLNKMLLAMKLDKNSDVYICNVVKCRPPQNRNPEQNEIMACQNYLFSQIALVEPEIIITLGRFSSQLLLNSTSSQAKLRGTVHSYNNIPVIVTYHPSYLLRNPLAKKDAWADLQLALKTMGKACG
jgi:DNA polymerase